MFKNKYVRLSDVYFALVTLAVTFSSIVFIEPSPSDILILIAFTLGFFRFFNDLSQIIIPAFLLLLYIVANLLFSFVIKDIERGIFILFIRVYLVLSWWLFVEIGRRFGNRFIKTIFIGYTFAAIIAVILGLAALFNFIHWDILLYNTTRPKALFKDPNVFGPFLIPVALYAALNFESLMGLPKLYWLLIFITTSLGTFFSFSRAAWLNYTVAFFIYLVLRFLTTSSAKTVIHLLFFYGFLITTLAFTFVTLFTNQPEIADFFIQRFALQKYDDDRFGVQEEALDDFLSSDLLGIGPGQVEATYSISTHSLYVRLLVETSFLGTFSFLGLIIITLKLSLGFVFKKSSKSQGIFIVLISSIVGILANSFFIDSLHWRHFWLILALPWALQDHVKQSD